MDLNLKKDENEKWTESTKTLNKEHYTLKLYVIGQTKNSRRTVENLNKICEEHLCGRYTTEIIDLLEKPQLAKEDRIIAVPALIRELPESVGHIIGDL